MQASLYFPAQVSIGSNILCQNMLSGIRPVLWRVPSVPVWGPRVEEFEALPRPPKVSGTAETNADCTCGAPSLIYSPAFHSGGESSHHQQSLDRGMTPARSPKFVEKLRDFGRLPSCRAARTTSAALRIRIRIPAVILPLTPHSFHWPSKAGSKEGMPA